ncbi:hypothetical protein LJ753_16780 [Arthrobacter sp. zg-Y20]|uniref:hypothetical protein n=1 Tax=unclassified Arthrobacter TaxID=235627 RepID=UPI001D15D012|nr:MULTISPECIES: hypothetical protein [unclassified Arthrobacter]MCC3277521.1 hypothetical protein [Arthrobacter sp. zg-Y20]MDK1317680.1 hypothetical protein [Arthrobacter sp. zg.Y20]WIB07061.1 hypothetical protein QNO06_04855 [Arthrobacter sp. zg-Y20]
MKDDQVRGSVELPALPATVSGRFAASRLNQRSRDVIDAGNAERDTRFRHRAEHVRAPSRRRLIGSPHP